MVRKNKYIYFAVLQGNYRGEWEDLCSYDMHNKEDMRLLKSDRKAYAENEPQYAHRVIHRRELADEGE